MTLQKSISQFVTATSMWHPDMSYGDDGWNVCHSVGHEHKAEAGEAAADCGGSDYTEIELRQDKSSSCRAIWVKTENPQYQPNLRIQYANEKSIITWNMGLNVYTAAAAAAEVMTQSQHKYYFGSSRIRLKLEEEIHHPWHSISCK